MQEYFPKIKKLHQIEEEDWNEVLDVNLNRTI